MVMLVVATISVLTNPLIYKDRLCEMFGMIFLSHHVTPFTWAQCITIQNGIFLNGHKMSVQNHGDTDMFCVIPCAGSFKMAYSLYKPTIHES